MVGHGSADTFTLCCTVLRSLTTDHSHALGEIRVGLTLIDVLCLGGALCLGDRRAVPHAQAPGHIRIHRASFQQPSSSASLLNSTEQVLSFSAYELN